MCYRGVPDKEIKEISFFSSKQKSEILCAERSKISVIFYELFIFYFQCFLKRFEMNFLHKNRMFYKKVKNHF